MIELTSEGIIKIIEACHKASVCHFKLDTLEINFINGVSDLSDTPVVPADPVLEAERLKQAEVDLKLEQLAIMRLENPFEYEQLVSRGELEPENANI